MSNHTSPRERLSRRIFLQSLAILAPAAAVAAAATDEAIPIDGGRQLLFDDYVIGETSLERTWHLPTIHPASPVLRPETPLELNGGQKPVACPFSGGVFHDPKDQLFKMWYHAGWFDGIAHATSEDGIHWDRPNLDVEPGTNRVIPKRDGYWRDGATVWLDQETADPSQRYKLFAYFRRRKPLQPVGEIYVSADGIHWNGPQYTGPITDNSNFYWDPFRKLWVWSIRYQTKERGRMRMRRLTPDFLGGADWTRKDIVGPLLAPDELDLPDPALGYPTQLYHMEANAYEGIMLGVFLIHRGPPNEICARLKIPKITEMTLAFSRDSGDHWTRPDRRSFIGCSRIPGTWNRAYIQPAGGVCLVVGDKLHFYFSAWSGISPTLGGDMYAGGSTGLAILRRDGFVSLDGDAKGGSLRTRALVFSGKHLFVNTAAKVGEVAVEVLDSRGVPLPGFRAKDCIPLRADGTRQTVRWKKNTDLASLAGKPVQFQFHVRRAQLYSFWVSPEHSGASFGYVAAGGPGFTSPRDTNGS